MKYPVISVKDGVFEFHTSETSLNRCTKTALKNAWFRGLKILDAGGVLYSVKDARFLRNTGEKTYPALFASNWLEVELEISGEMHLGIDEARQLIRRALRFSCRTSGYDLPGLLEDIDRAPSLDAIWKVVIPLLTSGAVKPRK